jgi:hypothetical protein
MVAKLIEDIRSEFHRQVETKTGWGRNEVKAALERAIANALAKNAGQPQGNHQEEKWTDRNP